MRRIRITDLRTKCVLAKEMFLEEDEAVKHLREEKSDFYLDQTNYLMN